jgi:hypothetical protein
LSFGNSHAFKNFGLTKEIRLAISLLILKT